MTKRLLIVVGVAVALLVLAVPAMAFNGYRADYTTADTCQVCHSGIAGIPATYNQWVETKHAVAGADDQALRLPYGSVCQGCHTSNFDPAKVIPTPTATSTTGAVSWGAGNGIPTEAQMVGNAASSENYVGCSSCHYGANVGGNSGADSKDTAHAAPFANLANAEICGQCHSRYSYTVNTFAVSPIPTPTASQTTLIQPQMALGGYKMLGEPATAPATGWTPAAPLSTVLNVQFPGWSPTPNPAATSAGLGRLQTYWKDAAGKDMMWQQTGHDGSAAQYPDWAIEGHANALAGLKAVMGPNPPASCLECHSTDYRIAVETGKTPPTGAQAVYGITCVGCHTPHENTTEGGAWDEEWTPQLRTGSAQTLCVECHNGEIPEGTSAAPGTEIHHPMKEMIDGYGAIDVSSFPSVHKGKCVQCHMPPTSISRGSVQLGGNHTFNIIEPEMALEASPIPVITASAVATATPIPAGTPVITTTNTVTWDSMPMSACSTCHNNNNGVRSTPQPVSTATAIPNPTASPLRVTVTVDQNANQSPWGNNPGGDRGLWLQDTIEQRQEWTKAKVAETWATLNKAAVAMGYKDTDAAQTALVAKPAAEWTTAERAFLSSFTNNEFVESEGSFGLHNWDYSREIVNAAIMQAKIAESGVIVRTPWVVTLKMSKSNVRAGTTVKFTGKVKTSKGVAGAGTVRIMRRVSGKWQVWLKDRLNSKGNYSVSQKLTRTGTFRIRAFMPANTTSLGAYSSPSLKLNVRR